MSDSSGICRFKELRQSKGKDILDQHQLSILHGVRTGRWPGAPKAAA